MSGTRIALNLHVICSFHLATRTSFQRQLYREATRIGLYGKHSSNKNSKYNSLLAALDIIYANFVQ